MRSFRADLALLGLAVIALLSDLACILTNHTPPALFEQIALAGLTGAAGVAQVVPGSASSSPQTSSPAAAGPVADYSGPVGS